MSIKMQCKKFDTCVKRLMKEYDITYGTVIRVIYDIYSIDHDTTEHDLLNILYALVYEGEFERFKENRAAREGLFGQN